MKLFKIRGGVHPEGRKRLSADKQIEILPIPDLLHIPFRQHVGEPAEPVVKRGDRVLKGQLIAKAKGPVSAPIHAPTSGRVLAVGAFTAPHPSGLPARTIHILTDGRDEWGERMPSLDPETASPAELSQRVADAGIVGMGGAAFPSAVKLNLGERYNLQTLVINGAECEPYLTCDDRLMREFPERAVDGCRIMAKALRVKRVIVAIETNKPEAIDTLTKAAAEYPEITIVGVPTRYPMGSEKHLVQTLTGKETPSGKLTADIGVVVHNVATACAVHDAVRKGKPLVSRVVTVSGGAIAEPRNIRVPIGVSIESVIDYCGGTKEKPARLMMGGPMMGQPVVDARSPMVKGCNGILALTLEETRQRAPSACIRCASCVQVCPCGLVPLEMAARIKHEDVDGAVAIGLTECLSCGSCNYVCPAHLPLVQYFNYGKGRVKAIAAEKRKQEETKRLAEARIIRLEEQMRAKKALLAKRKAEAEAKAKAKAEAEAAVQDGEADSPPGQEAASNDNVKPVDGDPPENDPKEKVKA